METLVFKDVILIHPHWSSDGRPREWRCNADANTAMIQAISDCISGWRVEEQATARDDNNEAEDKQ
eukprot:7289881-Ditylum_brightwellii.AAC.1